MKTFKEDLRARAFNTMKQRSHPYKDQQQAHADRMYALLDIQTTQYEIYSSRQNAALGEIVLALETIARKP